MCIWRRVDPYRLVYFFNILKEHLNRLRLEVRIGLVYSSKELGALPKATRRLCANVSRLLFLAGRGPKLMGLEFLHSSFQPMFPMHCLSFSVTECTIAL